MRTISVCMAFFLFIASVGPADSGVETSGRLILRLSAGDYDLVAEADDQIHILMDGYGEYDPESAWSIPARRFLFALPPGAQVTRVEFSAEGAQPLPGSYQLSPPASLMPGGIDGEEAVALADSLVVAPDISVSEVYPAASARYLGQGQWRRYTYARLEFSPFQYDAIQQRLLFTPSVQVTLDYKTPRPGTARWRQVQETLNDTVMEDLIAGQLENYIQAQQWYPTSATAASSTYNYVIVVPGETEISAVQPLKEWKEKIGFSVKVVTMPEVLDAYSGDRAERLWNYLHDRYPAGQWGIRYVLLVGDVDQIPMRYLYPDSGNAYGSDYYYAKLSTTDWDVDGDRRWGEFTQDNLDITPDVIVGRIPFNESAEILDISNAIVDFEKDVGGWKRNVLLAHGILDYHTISSKTDTALVAEMVKADFLQPNGWSSTSLYEQGGIAPSVYTPDLPLSQANFTNSLQNESYGVVNLLAHGNPGEMASFTWPSDVNNDGLWDPQPPLSEIGTTRFTGWSQVKTFPAKGAVLLIGCSTAAILGDNPELTTSEAQSLTINTTRRNDIMVKEYLRYGAPAVIGSTAGSDYGSLWTGISRSGEQSLNYYILENLIQNDHRLGDAFFEAMLHYAQKHGLARGIRVFNYFGDPALIVKGIDDRPGGADSLVKEGSYREYAGDYADDGTMYVGVLTTSTSQVPGRINIYSSTDHGQSWAGWTFVEDDVAIWDLDILVGNFQEGDYIDNRVHVVYSTGDGRVVDVRIRADDPDSRQVVPVAQAGHWAKNVSLARDPGPTMGNFNIYLAWEYEEAGEYFVKLARSANTQTNWIDTITLQGRQMPHVDAGPAGKVYTSMLESGIPLDVYVYVSTDYGETWPDEFVLTRDDQASMHTSPVVAASNDPAYPSVWVVYSYEYQSDDWGHSRDLRFAYSSDAGVTWTRDQILAADQGVDEWLPDIASYHLPPNRWVNLAYAYDPYSSTGYPRNIIWRYSSGSSPGNWQSQRIVNDYAAGAPYADAPLVLYSPGAGPGSGVVYGGANRNNLYFSAPWLAVTTSSASAQVASTSASGDGAPGQDDSVLANLAIDPPPLYWRETGDLPGVTAIGDLAFVPSTGMLAAGVANREAGNQGVVLLSDDGGQSWQDTGPLAEAWSLSSLAILPGGNWAAGGVSLAEDQPVGMIYRSGNYGTSWSPVFSQNGLVVYDLLVVSSNRVLAATGPSGKIFLSSDGMRNWDQLATLGTNTNVNALLSATNGDLYAALQTASGGKLARSKDGGLTWQPVGVFDGIQNLYALAQSGEHLYVAGKGTEVGWVFRCNLAGEAWERLPEIDPNVRSVTSLIGGPLGTVFAGAQMKTGIGATRVYHWTSAGEWAVIRDELDLASAVYDLEISNGRLYAGTGYIYGNVYEVALRNWLYLPNLFQALR
jgi:photosystem II stability/assembly factor-like uncharacterized protein